MTTTGMCERCRNDAALPDSDYCADCTADNERIARTAEVIQLTDRMHQRELEQDEAAAPVPSRCLFAGPDCDGRCGHQDCVEFGPGTAA